MARPKVAPKNEQRRFEIEELFYSTTDHAGVILSGNEVFRRVAGFESLEELVGRPHNIIRHPDMPRAVFKLLWDYLGAGKPIVAYVKNLATDGAYYWVMAYVVPIQQGYLSVRFKPSSPILGVVEGLYRELLAIEAEAQDKPGLRQQAMEAAGAAAMEALKGLGFADYDAFMRAAMVSEMSSRAALMEGHGRRAEVRPPKRLEASYGQYRKQEEILDRMFARARRILETIALLESGSAELERLAKGTHLLAMNALVSCKRMGNSARGLSVVAQELSAIAQSSGGMIREMTANLNLFVGALNDAAFRVSAAKLQVGIALVFLEELALEGGHEGAEFTARHLGDLEVLTGSVAKAIEDIGNSEHNLHEPVGPLRLRLDALQHIGRSLACVYHMGKVEAAVSGEAEQFHQLLNSLGRQVEAIRPVVEAVRSGIDSVLDEMPGLEEDSLALFHANGQSLTCAA